MNTNNQCTVNTVASACLWHMLSNECNTTQLSASTVCYLCYKIICKIVRPSGTVVQEGLMFYNRCFFATVSPSSLGRSRHETFPHDLYLRQLYNASPKIRGPQLKNFTLGKMWADFAQLPTLIANTPWTSQDIQNRKDMSSRTIPPAFGKASPVNFGPLSTK